MLRNLGATQQLSKYLFPTLLAFRELMFGVVDEKLVDPNLNCEFSIGNF